MSEDIIDYKQIEERQRQSDIIVSSTTGIIALLDKDYTYLTVNPAYLRIVKKTYDQIIGKNAVSIFGKKFFNEVIKPRGDHCLKGEEVHFEEWFDFPATGKRYMEVHYYPHFGVDNKIKGFVVSGKDITDRKQAEDELRKYRNNLEELVEERTQQLKISQDKLLHSKKLASLGKLTGALSHEFNNPLQGLRNILDILSGSDLSEKEVKLAKLGISECDRMARMIFGLRDFYKPTTGKTSQACINKCLEEILILENSSLEEKGIQVNKHFSDKLPLTEVVKDQIKQVLLNMIQNCADSISGEGQITLTTEEQGSNIIINIKDTGCGISEDDKKNLFEPFFTTKNQEQGTGLGLSISYGIIQDHGGDIKVESELNEGSTFTISLPIKRS
jgi:PAS domain S-box-containing protein